MLFIPPKMQNALDMGNFQPVGAVKITTGILDAPPSSQTWIDNTGNLVNVSDKFNVKQAYPDPSATGTQINDALPFDANKTRVGLIFSAGSANIIAGPVDLLESGVFRPFTVGEDIQQASNIKSATVILKRTNQGSTQIRAKIFEIDQNGNLLDPIGRSLVAGIFGQGILSPTIFNYTQISTSTPTEYTFIFDDLLKEGQKYALAIYAENSFGDFGKTEYSWYGEETPTEPENIASRMDARGSTSQWAGLLSLKLDFSAYDSTPTPELEIRYDLGSIPLTSGEWDLDDRPAVVIDALTGGLQTTSISYRAWATDATYNTGTGTDLGIINTSSPTIANLSRYYVLRATFTATANGLRTHSFLGATPKFASVQNQEAASYIFSTSKLPFSEGVGLEKMPNISFNLSPGKPIAERSGVSAVLLDIGGRVTRRMIEANIKNLPFEVLIGDITSTVESDMLTTFSGQITGFDFEEGKISLKAEDATTKFKQKIPRIIPEPGDNGRFSYRTDGVRRVYEGQEIMNTGLGLLRAEGGFREKEIDTQSFEDFRAALQASAAVSPWITNLKIKDEKELDNIMKQIMTLSGGYMTIREEGKVVVFQFPRLGISDDDWDDNDIFIGDLQPESWKQTQKNQVTVQYDALGDGEGKGKSGYLDLQAQLAWYPGSGRDISDQVIKNDILGDEPNFNGDTISAEISKRIVDTRKNGLLIYKCKTHFNKIGVQVGNLVGITTKTYLKKGQIGAIAVQFMVIGKSFSDGTEISWRLIENITTQKFPTASFTATPTSGLPTLNVQVNASASFDNNSGGSITGYEWDFNFNGRNFIPDLTRITAIPATFPYTTTSVGIKRIALRVTNGFGGTHIITTGQALQPPDIRVLAVPVAAINTTFADPNNPSIAQLSSASYGITGAITLLEWDIGYDGVTFFADQVGEAISVPLLSVALTVGLRATDEDGQTAIATVTLPASTKAIVPGVNVFSVLLSQYDEIATGKNNVAIQAIKSSGTNNCAVGDADGTDAHIMTSEYLNDWVERSNPKNIDLLDLVFITDSIIVAVGDADGTDAYILRSTNKGSSWSEISNPKNFRLNSIAKNDDASVIVAVGDADGTDAYTVRSLDQGLTWIETSNALNVTLRGVTHNGSVFCSLGDRATGVPYGGKPYAITSSDGLAWDNRTGGVPVGAYDVRSVISSSAGNSDLGKKIVAVGGSIIHTSMNNGLNWTALTIPGLPGGFQMRYIEWNGYIYAISGFDGTLSAIYGTSDLINLFKRRVPTIAGEFNLKLHWNGSEFLIPTSGNVGVPGKIFSSLSMIN